jgi:iron complex transport system ATP-binding protein
MDPAQGEKRGVLVKERRSAMMHIHDISAHYGDTQVLDNINLQVGEGEIVGLVGPNGAGKSTLIKVLSGVLQASDGEVYVAGQPMTSLSPAARARRIAVVPQARQLGGAFSVRQAVLLGRTAYLGFLGKPGQEDLKMLEWAMEATAVQELADRKLAAISGGEQQRVLLARALAQDPRVLLLDEPTNHLDLKYQVSLLRLLRDLVDKENLSVLMAMHDLNQLSGVVDRVALLVAGKLKAVGKPAEVLTSDSIKDAYQTEVETFQHPQTGKHYLFPKT